MMSSANFIRASLLWLVSGENAGKLAAYHGGFLFTVENVSDGRRVFPFLATGQDRFISFLIEDLKAVLAVFSLS